jgi:hypothetical protein
MIIDPWTIWEAELLGMLDLKGKEGWSTCKGIGPRHHVLNSMVLHIDPIDLE